MGNKATAGSWLVMSKTLLIVDDDECLCKATKSFLSYLTSSVKIRTTTSPLEALNLVISEQIDFILCDFLMPEMNGLELLQAIRIIGYDRPFVFLTGYSVEDIEPRARESGALACYEKGSGISVYYDILSMLNG
jgi:CheY-like chemotaxis protein